MPHEGQRSFIHDRKLTCSVNLKRTTIWNDYKNIFEHSRADVSQRLIRLGEFTYYISVRKIATAIYSPTQLHFWSLCSWKENLISSRGPKNKHNIEEDMGHLSYSYNKQPNKKNAYFDNIPLELWPRSSEIERWRQDFECIYRTWNKGKIQLHSFFKKFMVLFTHSIVLVRHWWCNILEGQDMHTAIYHSFLCCLRLGLLQWADDQCTVLWNPITLICKQRAAKWTCNYHIL